VKSYAQKRSRLQEKRAARDIGGLQQKGSGSSPFAKGDFRKMGDVRGECKFTRKTTYILKEDDLKKIQLEALKGGFEDWVMQVEFVGDVGQSKKFAVLDYKMFQEMWQSPGHSHHAGTSKSQSSVAQVGKSFQFKVEDALKYSAMHVIQLAFVEDNESMKAMTQPPKLYAIVPWQVYVDVRGAYLELQEERNRE